MTIVHLAVRYAMPRVGMGAEMAVKRALLRLRATDAKPINDHRFISKASI